MTASKGIGRGGRRLGAGRKPLARALVPIAAAQDEGLQVEQMAAIGEPPETIARSLSLTLAELNDRHGDPLEHGAARRRRELIALMFEAARAGSTPALMWLVNRTEAAVAERQAREPLVIRVGKKAQKGEAAQRRAEGGRLAPPRPPRLKVVS